MLTPFVYTVIFGITVLERGGEVCEGELEGPWWRVAVDEKKHYTEIRELGAQSIFCKECGFSFYVSGQPLEAFEQDRVAKSARKAQQKEEQTWESDLFNLAGVTRPPQLRPLVCRTGVNVSRMASCSSTGRLLGHGDFYYLCFERSSVSGV